jgi:hypothetical protein
MVPVFSHINFFRMEKILEETEQEIIELSAEKYRWYTEQQIGKVEDLYDDSLIFVHLNGHISSKKEWVGEMRSGSFVYDRINIREASAKVYGNTAVLVGKATFVVNGGSKYNLAYTEVYTKKSNAWKLVNVHTCSGY